MRTQKKVKLKPSPEVAAVENSVQTIDQICERAKAEVFQKVLDQVKKHPNSPWSGKPLLELESTLKAVYKNWGVKIKGTFRNQLPKTMQDFYDKAKTASASKSKSAKAIIGKPDPARVNYFLKSSFQYIAGRTDKMAADHVRQLRQISADVMRECSITGASRAEVSRKMITRATTQIPGFQFTDRAGRNWSNKNYFTMLARTELMNAGRAAYDDQCAQNGDDIMILDFSGGSCHACDAYEGKIFSLTGITKGIPSKNDLIRAGVFHPNCTHSYSVAPDDDVNEQLLGIPPEPQPIKGQAAPFSFFKKNKPEQAEQSENDHVIPDTNQARINQKHFSAVKGMTPEIQNELLWNTEDTRLKGFGLPKVIIGKNEITRTDLVTIHINPIDGFERSQVTHEFGHFIANKHFEISNQTVGNIKAYEAFQKCIIEQVTKIDMGKTFPQLQSVMEHGREREARDFLSEKLFKTENFSQLSSNEQEKVLRFGDTIAGMTQGAYGFGHEKEYYDVELNAYMEVFANAYTEHKYQWEAYKQAFPELIAFIEKEFPNV